MAIWSYIILNPNGANSYIFVWLELFHFLIRIYDDVVILSGRSGLNFDFKHIKAPLSSANEHYINLCMIVLYCIVLHASYRIVLYCIFISLWRSLCKELLNSRVDRKIFRAIGTRLVIFLNSGSSCSKGE